MEVNIGKYTVCSDQWCMWIEEEYTYTGKKGRNKDKQVTEKKRVAGYSSNFRQLLKSFMEHKYRNSDAKSVEELLVTLQETEKEILQIIDKCGRLEGK